jgi:serine protease Do
MREEGLEGGLTRMPEIRIPDTPRVFTSWRSGMLGIESESLGSQLAEFFGVKEGALVRSVTKGTPADKAGLKAGDVIVKVEDHRVSGPREVAALLRAPRTKKTFPLTVVRDRKEIVIQVTLDDDSSMRDRRGERPDGLEL